MARQSAPATAQNPVVTSLRLDPRRVKLSPGEQVQFQISVNWSNGATIVPALIWAVDAGQVSPRGLYTAGAVPGTHRVIAMLESGLLADTSIVTVQGAVSSPPQPPPPASVRPAAPPASVRPAAPPPTRGDWKEPAGFIRVTSRDFSSKAKTDSDRGADGSQGWDGAEFRYSNLTIAQDRSAPLSPPNFLRMLYPPRAVRAGTTFSPGVVQTLSLTGQAYGARKYRKIYLRTAFRVSANWQGHSTSTNKMFFVRATQSSASRPEPIIRLRGAGSGPLQLNVDLQGSPRDKRNIGVQSNLPPNQGVAVANNVQRGQWHLLEAVLEMGGNGQANGRLRLWLDGALTHDYSDIEYEGSGSQTAYWDVLHIAPTWGGIGGTINALMWLDYDEFYVSGAP